MAVTETAVSQWGFDTYSNDFDPGRPTVCNGDQDYERYLQESDEEMEAIQATLRAELEKGEVHVGERPQPAKTWTVASAPERGVQKRDGPGMLI